MFEEQISPHSSYVTFYMDNKENYICVIDMKVVENPFTEDFVIPDLHLDQKILAMKILL